MLWANWAPAGDGFVLSHATPATLRDQLPFNPISPSSHPSIPPSRLPPLLPLLTVLSSMVLASVWSDSVMKKGDGVVRVFVTEWHTILISAYIGWVNQCSGINPLIRLVFFLLPKRRWAQHSYNMTHMLLLSIMLQGSISHELAVVWKYFSWNYSLNY